MLVVAFSGDHAVASDRGEEPRCPLSFSRIADEDPSRRLPNQPAGANRRYRSATGQALATPQALALAVVPAPTRVPHR